MCVCLCGSIITTYLNLHTPYFIQMAISVHACEKIHVFEIACVCAYVCRSVSNKGVCFSVHEGLTLPFFQHVFMCVCVCVCFQDAFLLESKKDSVVFGFTSESTRRFSAQKQKRRFSCMWNCQRSICFSGKFPGRFLDEKVPQRSLFSQPFC